MPSAETYKLFAVSSPGLEPFTAQELRELGMKLCHPSAGMEHCTMLKEWGEEGGGVEFLGSLAEVYRANLRLRTASRVLVRTHSNRDLRNLYAQFGAVLRAKCPGWQFTMLCGSQRLLYSTGLKFDKGITVDNGGLKVKLVRGRIQR